MEFDPYFDFLEACSVGNVEHVKEFLENGMSPNANKGYNVLSPLMRSAIRGHTEVVNILLERGACTKAFTMRDPCVTNYSRCFKYTNDVIKVFLDSGMHKDEFPGDQCDQEFIKNYPSIWSPGKTMRPVEKNVVMTLLLLRNTEGKIKVNNIRDIPNELLFEIIKFIVV